MDIAPYHQQHLNIMSGIKQLRELFKLGVRESAEEIFDVLVHVSAQVTIHLAAEDSYVYPELMRSSNRKVAETAKIFQDEMGEIAKIYLAFTGKWSSALEIGLKSDEFSNEANVVFQALYTRIQQENEILYPMVK